MNENKPPFQHVVHSSVLSAKTLKLNDTKESHPEHYRTHSFKEFYLLSITNRCLMKLYSETHRIKRIKLAYRFL